MMKGDVVVRKPQCGKMKDIVEMIHISEWISWQARPTVFLLCCGLKIVSYDYDSSFGHVPAAPVALHQHMLAPFHYGSSFNSRILCGAVSSVGILLTLSHRKHKGVHTFLCSIAFERRLARHSCSCVVIVFNVKEWCKVLWPPWVPTTSMFCFLLFTKGLSFLKISIGLSYGVRTRRTIVVCVPDLSFNYTFTFGIWSDVVCESSKLLLGCLSSSHLYFQRVKRKKGYQVTHYMQSEV